MKYYDPAHLYVAETPIFLRVNCEEVVGFVKFTPAGKHRWHVGTLRDHYALPPRCKVEAWRPVDPDQFPDQLPASPKKLMAEPDWKRPPEPPSTIHDDDNGDWWVKPCIRLGRPGEPPESLDECMVRIFRALATRRHEHRRVDIEDRWLRYPSDVSLPTDRQGAAKLHQYLKDYGVHPKLRQSDYDDFWLGTTEDSESPRQPWEPTPRDKSEFDDGRVFGWIPPSARKIFALRSYRPPFSFFYIGKELGVDERTAKQRFDYQCERAFRKAKNG